MTDGKTWLKIATSDEYVQASKIIAFARDGQTWIQIKTSDGYIQAPLKFFTLSEVVDEVVKAALVEEPES